MPSEQIAFEPITIQKTTIPLFKVLWRVYGYLKPYWKHTAGGYLSLLAIIGLSTLIPQFIRWIIDTGIDGNKPDVLTWSILALVGLTLIKGVFNYLMGIASETASQNVAFDLRNEIQKKLTQLSFSFHDQSETGELLSRAVQDVERIRFLTGRATIRILDGALMLIISSIIMLVMDYKLALLVLLTMPFLVFRAVNFGVKYRPLSLQVQKQLAVLTTTVEQNLRGSRIVKAYAQEDAEIERFAKENTKWFDLSVASARMQAINVPLLFLIANMSIVAIILYGGSQVIKGQITIGEVIAFITYVGLLVDPIRRLGLIIPAVAIAGSAAERVFDILDTVSEVKDEPGAESLPRIAGFVSFEAVSFSYGKRKVLSNISFQVAAGEVIALLGATGSGKSSIISLLPRFYDPTEGKILFDSHDIRSVTLKSLRSQIGVVLQETTLFAGSIKENIAFGCNDATDEKIIEVAKAAQAHDFILKTDHGYDTRVGERGVTLSGGQKQRLAIARALLMDPRILILDDATASVDSETEHLIQIAIEALIRNRTTFVIAHRLSTVRKADLILVLDNGQISAYGTHQSLLKTSQIYRDIYNNQLKNQESQL
jgi:ATP-binding cassette subfamily B protein